MSSSNSLNVDIRASIAGALAEDIVAGRLRAGADLNSVELARRFQTSRTPVREALLMLEKAGLVEIESRRRPRVRRWTRAEVRELYLVRSALYALVAEQIVGNASDEDLDLLHACYDELAAAADARDLERFFAANVAFREIEARICRNSQLQQILDSLGLRVQQLRHYSISLPGGMNESRSDRERLIRAYYERDAQLAAALSRSTVLRALARIEHSGWRGME
ncbi:MAG TPA: GntR family transcriptional regulator [Vicinamibacterales bacterium]